LTKGVYWIHVESSLYKIKKRVLALDGRHQHLHRHLSRVSHITTSMTTSTSMSNIFFWTNSTFSCINVHTDYKTDQHE